MTDEAEKKATEIGESNAAFAMDYDPRGEGFGDRYRTLEERIEAYLENAADSIPGAGLDFTDCWPVVFESFWAKLEELGYRKPEEA